MPVVFTISQNYCGHCDSRARAEGLKSPVSASIFSRTDERSRPIKDRKGREKRGERGPGTISRASRLDSKRAVPGFALPSFRRRERERGGEFVRDSETTVGSVSLFSPPSAAFIAGGS